MSAPLIRRNREAGVTLVELLVVMLVMSLIMASSIAAMRSQSRNLATGSKRFEMMQDLRFALTTIERTLRTAGAGVSNQQPMLVYGSDSVVAINADFTSNVQYNCSVNVNPDAPAGAVDVLPQSAAYILPSTTFTYPSMTYPAGSCRAETIIFYFRRDSTTADPNDFLLLQKVNAMPSEMVARNIYPYPGRPFFEYYVHPLTLLVPPATRDSLVRANVAGSGITLPIIHSVTVHGSVGDSAGSTSALADSVRAIRVNVRITNGQTGANQQVRDVATVVPIRNNGLAARKTCGSSPLLSGALTATPNVVGTAPKVTLTWPASLDEAGGEQDVTQYNVYRRLLASATFGSALITIPAGAPPPYSFQDGSVSAGVAYVYAVAAQDCTPAESPFLVSPTVTPN